MVSSLNITQLVRSRRSIRRFKPDKVPQSVIKNILNLARWAPSAHNAQPWRFIVIDDDKLKERLAAEMGKVWLSDMQRDGVPREKAEEIVKLESWDRITKSPIVLIVCLTMKDMHSYPDARRRKAEYIMGVQSVAAYIQTLLLLTHFHGLCACWICAPLFCPNIVRKALGLPKKFDPQAMVIMGYADEKLKPPPRKPLNDIYAFNIWSKP